MLRWIGNVVNRLMGKNSTTSTEERRESQNPTESDINQYIDFLSELLQAKIDNNDTAVIYGILQRHQPLLDEKFAILLQSFARNVFSEGKTDQATATAAVINNLCLDIQQFPLGSRSNNLEIAIIGYETILQVYTPQAFPLS
ncbi:MAG: hypothetical protein AB4062_15595 [Crocosphaera sp.]